MVPGMGHCGGGLGPDIFDSLTALDEWVAHGVAPDGIIAANSHDWRTMPLCKFPEEARSLGGPTNYAGSWACDPTDRRLLADRPGRPAGGRRPGLPRFSRAAAMMRAPPRYRRYGIGSSRRAGSFSGPSGAGRITSASGA